ncbi:MAG: type VII secretion protein EccB [Mycobacteriaceae bacterium]|uniref:type VII secretion protein EccB n=1 Tax=Corynebacterium sp. TaxID=1720 RepID=UPI003F9E5F37
MRTTGLQVSGYAFLLRRTELALVTGDARMAQDPLRAQRRAVGVGVLLSLLVAGGMLLVAMLRPQPSIDSAGLVADESGALHVRIEDTFHPVANVASARLLLGAPEEVTTSTSAQLGQFPTGPPVGIPDTPGLVAAPVSQWALCDGRVTAEESLRDVGPVVLQAPSGMWLVVDSERMLLAGADDGDGRGGMLARALGASPVTVTETMVQVLDRGPDVALTSLDRIVTSGDRSYLAGEGDDAGVAELTGSRRAVAEALAVGPPTEMPLPMVLDRPEVSGVAALSHVPTDLGFEHADAVCVGDRVVDAGPVDADPVGETVHYSGPRGTSAVLTERGFALVSQAGVRYSLESAEDLAALGVWDPEDGNPPEVPWRVLEPLPDGGVLSVERASYTMPGA